jgi:DNA-binding NarL/FixJ family response regulator
MIHSSRRMKKINVLMFEDSPEFTKGMTNYFEDSADIEIVKIIPNAINVVAEVEKYAPDVVVMDYQMPGGTNGVNAIEQLKIACSEELKIMMLTTFMDKDVIFGALAAGAKGYVVKSHGPEAVETAINDVVNGGGYFSPEIALRVAASFEKDIVKKQEKFVDLTPREKIILKEMHEGKSRKMIAASLDRSIHTVGEHLNSIYKKLHVNSAPAAVREAIRRGIV